MAAMTRKLERALCDSADRPEFFLLEDAQQFDLDVERQLSDLIEECGTPIGHVEQAELLIVSAGEGALGVAENLTFHERPHHGGAIHHDKRSSAFQVMDGTGDNFLAGTRLAEKEHGKARFRHARNALVRVSHSE